MLQWPEYVNVIVNHVSFFTVLSPPQWPNIVTTIRTRTGFETLHTIHQKTKLIEDFEKKFKFVLLLKFGY